MKLTKLIEGVEKVTGKKVVLKEQKMNPGDNTIGLGNVKIGTEFVHRTTGYNCKVTDIDGDLVYYNETGEAGKIRKGKASIMDVGDSFKISDPNRKVTLTKDEEKIVDNLIDEIRNKQNNHTHTKQEIDSHFRFSKDDARFKKIDLMKAKLLKGIK